MKLMKNNAVKERFWAKVKKTKNCWIWMASRYWDGYGQFSLNGKMHKAHRIAYQLEIGKITKDFCVLHRCDNRPCVRPDHLFLGTKKTNIQDMIDKNRDNFPLKKGHKLTQGENNPMANITEPIVINIRRLYKSGKYTQKKLASMFGICRSQITSIVNRVSWKHIQ